MTDAGAHARALEAVERLLDRGGDADEVLRGVVHVLHERLGRFVGVRLVEEGELVDGPSAGEWGARTASFPIRFQGAHVADLEAAEPLDDADRVLLERVATIVAPYALVAWDTGGKAWEP
jgi:hypothetical protein